jgi:hypothetical protein
MHTHGLPLQMARQDTIIHPNATYFMDTMEYKVTTKNMTRALKVAVLALDYPEMKGIPINCINTHSLRSRGANALALAGHSNKQIQKMGRWKGATFKEYICEELTCFSTGMSKDIKRKFNFVNIVGSSFVDVTDTILAQQPIFTSTSLVYLHKDINSQHNG